MKNSFNAHVLLKYKGNIPTSYNYNNNRNNCFCKEHIGTCVSVLFAGRANIVVYSPPPQVNPATCKEVIALLVISFDNPVGTDWSVSMQGRDSMTAAPKREGRTEYTWCWSQCIMAV